MCNHVSNIATSYQCVGAQANVVDDVLQELVNGAVLFKIVFFEDAILGYNQELHCVSSDLPPSLAQTLSRGGILCSHPSDTNRVFMQTVSCISFKIGSDIVADFLEIQRLESIRQTPNGPSEQEVCPWSLTAMTKTTSYIMPKS